MSIIRPVFEAFRKQCLFLREGWIIRHVSSNERKQKSTLFRFDYFPERLAQRPRTWRNGELSGSISRLAGRTTLRMPFSIWFWLNVFTVAADTVSGSILILTGGPAAEACTSFQARSNLS